MTTREKLQWALIGFLLMSIFLLWGKFATTVFDAAQWRCIEYSPVDGECVLFQRKEAP